MVRNVVFVMTHLASDYEKLVDVLNTHPLVHVFNTGRSYAHPDDVRSLREQPHKNGGAASIWGDVILHNKDFAMKYVCQHYKLIFWSSTEFEECAEVLQAKHGYGLQQAYAYLGYREDGLSQYWWRKYKTGVSCLWNPDLDQTDALFAAVF
jgi:hypothetical protein